MEHDNRAGDKLAELSEISNLLDGVTPGSAFLDLCGGPGAWSQHLLMNKGMAFRGFGFTLKSGSGTAEDWKSQAKDQWYEDLIEHPNWNALWGADGTGDLLKPGNLEHAVKQLAKEKVLLVVADGGYSDNSIPPNLLELYFYRLFLGELLMAVSCLSQGGKFVCKLYTAFSTPTAALLFLTTRMFAAVEIVKPVTSKATGPERYLVATGFLDNAESSTIQAALAHSHAVGDGASPLVTPLLTSIVSAESLSQDEKFTASMGAMVRTLCDRQAQALNAVVDRAIFLEDMALESAVITKLHSSRAVKEAPDECEHREKKTRDADFLQSIPTPARAGKKKSIWDTARTAHGKPESTGNKA